MCVSLGILGERGLVYSSIGVARRFARRRSWLGLRRDMVVVAVAVAVMKVKLKVGW